jgi:hypothetical protein
MREKSNNVFEKMLDWINYSFKVENDAVDEIDFIFRDYIEK